MILTPCRGWSSADGRDVYGFTPRSSVSRDFVRAGESRVEVKKLRLFIAAVTTKIQMRHTVKANLPEEPAARFHKVIVANRSASDRRPEWQRGVSQTDVSRPGDWFSMNAEQRQLQVLT